MAVVNWLKRRMGNKREDIGSESLLHLVIEETGNSTTSSFLTDNSAQNPTFSRPNTRRITDIDDCFSSDNVVDLTDDSDDELLAL